VCMWYVVCVCGVCMCVWCVCGVCMCVCVYVFVCVQCVYELLSLSCMHFTALFADISLAKDVAAIEVELAQEM